MKSAAIHLLTGIDRKGAKFFLRFMGEKDSLIVLLFHSVFENESEISKNLIAPQQATTVEHFEEIIVHFQEYGYHFTSPSEILDGLKPDEKYVLLTFDDGYFNNTRAVPILDKHAVPATFFISTDHVVQQKSFWWDSLHRNSNQSSKQNAGLQAFKNKLKLKKTCEIEKIIIDKIGSDALVPVSDVDRPLSPTELTDFANEQHVHIGNHTSDHAILTNYSLEEVHLQIRECQSALMDLTGETPKVISYPNGNHSPEILAAAAQEGLQLGITGICKKNYTPLVFDGEQEMKLGRMVPYGNISITEQCQSFRSDIGSYGLIKNAFNRLKTL